MKKNNKLTGIITLAVVAVLSIAIIIGTKYLTKYDDAGSEASTETVEGGIDISGYSNTGSILIRSAQELDDGYIVTVASKGFAGDIFMDVEFDKTGDNVKSLKINSHKETEGYGARITEDAFLSQFNGVPAPISLSGGAPVASKESEAVETVATTTETTTTESGTTSWSDGTYVAETEGFDQNGYINTVSLTIEGSKITEVIWDAYNEEGEYKSVLSADGAYVMTEDGPTWQEQAIAIADFVVQNQTTDAIYYDENGKTDSVASVSISVDVFVELVKKCLIQAGPTSLIDGVYTAEGTESNGYTGIVTIVVENGAITSVVWDGRNAAGEFKSYLSSVGEYVMVEGNPTWKEQADALAESVIANQSTSGIVMDEKGKTDSITGVSITVSEFVKLVENCLVQAATGEATADNETAEETPTEEVPAEDAAATGAIDGVSGATISSEAVVNGINKAQSFIKEFVLAK
jgi:major membrane immunogen (membrane-anchored lipoprotein)/Na+-translocating ferredoxin:NAD+ oxidoreductase RnfG subunit